MPALSEYTNVYDTALKVLNKKGYQFWFDEELELFCAEKEGWDFMAESPCSLLGVIAIYEFVNPKEFKEYWWKVEGENLYNSIPKQPKEYVSVIFRGKNT